MDLWGAVGAFLRIPIQTYLGPLFRVLFDLRVEGAHHIPREGPAVVACNHQGYLDPFFLQVATGRTLRFLMTANFYDIPKIRPFFKLCDAIRVSPDGSNRSALQSALDALAAGQLVGIFPEGKISLDGNFNRIHPGAAFLARRGKVPIVPARIRGSIRVLGKGSRPPSQAQVTLRLGAPLPPTRARDLREVWESL